MGRRQAVTLEPSGTLLEVDLDRAQRSPTGSRRGQDPVRPSRAAQARLALAEVGRWSVRVAFVLGLLLGALWIDDFLRRDSRFMLQSPPEVGQETPSILLSGVQHASRRRILTLFERDFGRSIYRVPLAERRRELQRMNWIRQASVSRVWPNQLRIQLVEREPAAFVPIQDPVSHTALSFLLDADGVILEHNNPGKFNLPVLTGVRREENLDSRRNKVHRMQALLLELGPLGDKISEIDASDPGNLRVTQQMDDRAITLQLGRERYRSRLQFFLQHYKEIQERRPDAMMVDLRLDNRVTVPRSQ